MNYAAKKKLNLLFSFFAIIFVVIAMLFVTAVSAGAEEPVSESAEAGRAFTKGSALKVPKVLSAVPQTYEAQIKLEPDFEGRGGVIIGTYKNDSSEAYNFEIGEGGAPRLYYTDGSSYIDIQFKEIDVRSGEWLHLAITVDGLWVRCYVNGELKSSIFNNSPLDAAPARAPMIGGDYRTGNDQYNMQYFKGAIKEVALFADARDSSEILADCNALDTDDTDLICAYELTDSCEGAVDLSENGYDIISPWVDEKDINIPTDYAYSFMVVGDTQIMTDQHPEYLHCIYDYIVDNVEAKKVKYVFGVGDITDNDGADEWEIAVPEIAKLDGVVRYSIVRGNHDIYSSGNNLSKISNFDKNYGSLDHPYANQYTYAYESGEDGVFRARNTIHFFEAGGIKYINVALDFGANDDILNWASEIISQYPYHNVIVSTHCYLDADGDYYDVNCSSDPERDFGSSANNGDEIFEKFVSKHPNITMVICGHAPSSNIVTRTVTDDFGRSVVEVLVDPQSLDNNATVSPTGLVATFYVSADGKTVTTTYYSTVKGKYYKAENNFTFELDVIEKPENTYTVTFDSNGADGVMDAFEDAAGYIAIPECKFTAPFEHSFAGWSTTPGTEIVDTKYINVTEDVTLYAVWKLNEYKITFRTGGSSIPDIIAGYNTPVTLPPNPTRQGYTFASWDREFPTLMPAENLVFTAKWTPSTDTPYRVEHYLEDAEGKFILDESLTEYFTATTGQTVTAVPKDLSDYDYYERSQGLSQKVNADGRTAIVIYYKIAEKYTVTVNGCGGTLKSGEEIQSVKKGALAIAPTYEREGYIFDGFDFDFTTPITSDITVNAKWIETPVINDGENDVENDVEIGGINDGANDSDGGDGAVDTTDEKNNSYLFVIIALSAVVVLAGVSIGVFLVLKRKKLTAK